MRIAFAAVIATLLVNPALAENGEQIFDDACASCHTGGFAGWWNDSPDIGLPEDWTLRLAKGADALTFGTIEGIGTMPPRGRCETCTDEQIRAAVEYMVEVLSN